jgi:Fungal specific transcription factor domain
VHQPPSESRQHSSLIPLAEAITADDEQAKRVLVQNATQQRQWEDYAIANTAVKTNLPKEISNELLKYHWCWIHPLFLFVYRPAFTRGMAMVNANSPDAPDPPYFSETLLKVIHAHCARFLNHSVHQHQYQILPNQQSPVPVTLSASQFMEKMTHEARVSLGLETLKPSSIPAIQALLQQSAREIVFARSSQGWLYAGMAFRMAFDIGIHLPSDKLQLFVKSLSAEDIEIRKRLFWSCYTWDKIVSLYLGRMPGFTPSTEDVPLSFMDDYSDKDLWAPYYGETPDPATAVAANYPPCPGYVVSCFRHLCKLCVILNDLMQDIYSSSAAARRNMEDTDRHTTADAKAANEAPFIKISRDLRDWWISLPSHLRIPPDQMPQLAPPVHIMSLNLTYHTTLILLHRPVILGTKDLAQAAAQRSYQVSIDATAAIHDLLMLQANTFGLSHVSYLNAYSAYIAATIAVLRFEREHKPGEDHTITTQTTGLNFLLEVLRRTAMSMPALDRSVAIIRKRMKAVLDRQAKSQLKSLFPDSSTPAPFTMAATPQKINLSHTTPYQAITTLSLINEYPGQDQNSAFLPSQNIPMPWQSDMRSSLYSEPVSEDVLPAFPGQQFPVGSEHSFGSDNFDVDPQARAALMGFNLDPHPRLNHMDLDWSPDAYVGESQQR